MNAMDCRYFNGYKPCGKNLNCDHSCTHYSPVHHRILVIGLGAMGAVLRATSLLPGIVKKYPGCHITWVTEKVSVPLLLNNPLIDQVLPLEFDSVL